MSATQLTDSAVRKRLECDRCERCAHILAPGRDYAFCDRCGLEFADPTDLRRPDRSDPTAISAMRNLFWILVAMTAGGLLGILRMVVES